MEEKSEIKKFYDGCNIFITGGSGFLGKILIEKLLRSTNVATIYLLIREKKGKDVHTRLDEMFDNIIFDRLKKEVPKFRHRIVGISGDCAISGLGLSINDRMRLMEEVDVVFHVAATVRFDENIKLAYQINVTSAGDVISLSRQMKRLKAMVHVSTAYSNCNRDEIDEVFYDPPVRYDEIGMVLEKHTPEECDQLTPKLLGTWPNTYTFTKMLAECLVKDLGKGLPIAVFRPSIILSTFKEPIDGWIDNFYGPTGVCAAVATGMMRILHCDGNKLADIVPVDTCVAGVIATAWDVANRDSRENIPIYNYVSSVENSITWGEYNILSLNQAALYPLTKSAWALRFHTESNQFMYLFYKLVFHILPAFLFDLGAFVTGSKPRMHKMYQKIHKFSDVLSFFANSEWRFRNQNIINLWNKMNTTDRDLFPLSIKTVAWVTFSRSYFKGLRAYLLQDPLHTLDEAKTRKRRFDVLHGALKFVLNFIFAMAIWTIFVNLWFKIVPSTIDFKQTAEACLPTLCSNKTNS